MYMKMNLLAVLSILGFAMADLSTDWDNFKVLHGKSYIDSNEELLRLKIYQNNLELIEEHNKRYELGLETYTLEMNEFGDMLTEEFEDLYLQEDMDLPLVHPRQIHSPENTSKIPDSIDWRSAGAVSPVKHQMACGACYAFSAAGALETQVFRKSGELRPLSVQQLVDCSRGYKNQGCRGGFPHWAFQYIRDHGIVEELDYPYEARENRRVGCKLRNTTRVAARLSDFLLIESGDEAELNKVVGLEGTVAMAVVLRGTKFRFYKSGVFSDRKCGKSRPDHTMLIVGYGRTPGGQDFWLVKNSWGTKWGEEGYVKMARNKDNHCAIASFASYPIL